MGKYFNCSHYFVFHMQKIYDVYICIYMLFLKVNLLLYICFIKFHLEAIESGLSMLREYQI